MHRSKHVRIFLVGQMTYKLHRGIEHINGNFIGMGFRYSVALITDAYSCNYLIMCMLWADLSNSQDSQSLSHRTERK